MSGGETGKKELKFPDGQSAHQMTLDCKCILPIVRVNPSAPFIEWKSHFLGLNLVNLSPHSSAFCLLSSTNVLLSMSTAHSVHSYPVSFIYFCLLQNGSPGALNNLKNQCLARA